MTTLHNNNTLLSVCRSQKIRPLFKCQEHPITRSGVCVRTSGLSLRPRTDSLFDKGGVWVSETRREHCCWTERIPYFEYEVTNLIKPNCSKILPQKPPRVEDPQNYRGTLSLIQTSFTLHSSDKSPLVSWSRPLCGSLAIVNHYYIRVLADPSLVFDLRDHGGYIWQPVKIWEYSRDWDMWLYVIWYGIESPE